MTVELSKLKRLAMCGSITAKAVALTLLDEQSGGKLMVEIEKLVQEGLKNEKVLE